MIRRFERLARQGLTVLTVVLAGCSSGYRDGYDALKLAMHGAPKVAPTANGVMSQPYFQMKVSSHDGQAVMVLGGVEGDRLSWYDHLGGGLFVEHGEIVRTIGLTRNLDDSHWLSADPFAQGLQHLDGPFTGTRVVDWSPGYRYGVRLDVQLAPAGTEDVLILGTVHHLRRVDEKVTAPAAGFSALNHYWVDPEDGLVWKSHQVVAPGIALDTVLLRPYRGNTP